MILSAPRALTHLNIWTTANVFPTGKSAIPPLRNGLEELTSASDKAIFFDECFLSSLSSRTYLPLRTYDIINM